MSFATGLFSFMGGMSAQYREEDEANKAAIATKAMADVEHAKWTTEEERKGAEHQFKVSKFETEEAFKKQKHRGELLLKRQEFGLEKKKFAQTELEFTSEMDLKKSELSLKKDMFTKKHGLDVDKFNLNEEEFTQAKDEYLKTFGLSEKQYELNKDKLDEVIRHNKETELIDRAEALMEAEEGITTYKGLEEGNDIKISSKSAAEKERLFERLSQYNGLSNEMINGLLPESKFKLQTDIKAALGQLRDLSFDETNNEYKDFTLDYKNLFNLDILNEAFDDVMDSIKQQQKKTFNENGIQADSVTLESGDGKIKASPINFDKWAKDAGFETKEQLLVSVNDLVAHSSASTKGSAWFTQSLSPFRDVESVYATMKNEGLPFTLLQLTPELNYVQEASIDATMNSSFYENLVSKAEEIGVIQPDGQGVDELYNFIYKIQPTAEMITKGGKFKIAETPEDAGKEIDAKSANDQFKAADIAVKTVDELILTIGQYNDLELFGAPTKAAALFQKVKNTFFGLQKLGEQIMSDGEDNPWRTVSKERRAQIIANFRKYETDIGGAGDNLQTLAARNARIEYLKFSLAYQMSMALQGGSGGRTISDQDVENMLRALKMEGIMGDASQVKASLSTVRTFMVSIRDRAKYESLNNIQGYRTLQHVSGIMNAMNIGNLEKLANEMNEKIYMTVDEQEAVSSELQMLGLASWDDVAYPTGTAKYMVYTTKNGWPVISFMREGGGSDREKGAYYMTQDMLDSFNASGKSKVLLQGIKKLPDGSPPEGALDDFSQEPIKFIGIQ